MKNSRCFLGFLACISLLLSGTASRCDAVGIVHGPVLSFPSENRISVWWRASGETRQHVVEYGETEALGKHVRASRSTQSPAITLTGLDPSQTYFYRVRSDQAISPVRSFHTLPAAGDPRGLRFGIWADNQNGSEVFTRYTIPVLQEYKPDFLMAVGDMVQQGDQAEQWRDHLFVPAANLLSSIGWFPVRGNHDGEGALAREMIPFPGDRSWYAFTAGTMRIAVLSSNLDLHSGSQQHSWFVNETRSEAWQKATFRAVAFHYPPWTNLWDDPDYSGDAIIRRDLVPVIENASTDLVFNGHAHCYQHAIREHVNGKTHYLIVGGGGGALDHIPSGTWPHFVAARSRHHVAIADVHAGSITMRIIDSITREILDQFEIASSVSISVPAP